MGVPPPKPGSGPLTSFTNRRERGREAGHLSPSFWNKGRLGRQEKCRRSKFWASWVGCPPVVPPVDGVLGKGPPIGHTPFLSAVGFLSLASGPGCPSAQVSPVPCQGVLTSAWRAPRRCPRPTGASWQLPGAGEGAEEKAAAALVWTFPLCSERGTCQPVPASSACTGVAPSSGQRPALRDELPPAHRPQGAA